MLHRQHTPPSAGGFLPEARPAPRCKPVGPGESPRRTPRSHRPARRREFHDLGSDLAAGASDRTCRSRSVHFTSLHLRQARQARTAARVDDRRRRAAQQSVRTALCRPDAPLILLSASSGALQHSLAMAYPMQRPAAWISPASVPCMSRADATPTPVAACANGRRSS
jgi:hypothetical protein